MLPIDLILFLVPAVLLQYTVGALPSDIVTLLAPLVLQALISLPVLMTFGVIVAGLTFELSQGSAVSSSEAVNWLPVSPKEYVAASALSMSALYSFILALAAGFTLPLALSFGLFSFWPLTIMLSVIGLFLGAFIVECLKSVTNRVSSSVYKKKGRLGLAVRLIALVLIFSIVQLAFQPTFLYLVIGQIVGGIELAWIVPFVWPSMALISLVSSGLGVAALFAALSCVFAIVMFGIAAALRQRYWSPVPVAISVGGPREYVPEATMRGWFGFNSMAATLAMKEFRALIRRKELSRFIAIPVILAVSVLVPTLATPSDMSGRGPGFFITAFGPFIVPMMLSGISIGQEGNSVANLLSLPIRATDLMKGKLAPAWLISSVATIAIVLLMQVVAPLALYDALATIAVMLIAIFINSFIGLAVGATWPDYTVGSRSRFVTTTGFIVGFLFCGLATLGLFAPIALHLITTGGVRGEVALPSIGLLQMFAVSLVIGAVLLIVSYRYCRRAVQNLLSNAT